MNSITRFIIFLSIVSFVTTRLYSQVTIGSAESPRKGVLLDLKQDNKSGNLANSSLAFGLPCVELGNSITDLVIDNASKKNNYVGAVVYNITKNNVFDIGVYVWNGTEWGEYASSKIIGANDQVLTLLEDNRSSFKTPPKPIYDFYKISGVYNFMSEYTENTPREYDYPSMTEGGNDPSYSTNYKTFPTQAAKDKFSRDAVYSTRFKTETSGRKFFEFAISVQMKFLLAKDFNDGTDKMKELSWGDFLYELYINKIKVGQLTQRYVLSASPTVKDNLLFKMEVPSKSVIQSIPKQDDNLIEVKIALLSSSFARNKGTGGASTANRQGNPFRTGVNLNFLTMEVVDFSLLFYEEDNF